MDTQRTPPRNAEGGGVGEDTHQNEHKVGGQLYPDPREDLWTFAEAVNPRRCLTNPPGCAHDFSCYGAHLVNESIGRARQEHLSIVEGQDSCCRSRRSLAGRRRRVPTHLSLCLSGRAPYGTVCAMARTRLSVRLTKSAPEGFVFANSERRVVVGSVVRWQVD